MLVCRLIQDELRHWYRSVWHYIAFLQTEVCAVKARAVMNVNTSCKNIEDVIKARYKNQSDSKLV